MSTKITNAERVMSIVDYLVEATDLNLSALLEDEEFAKLLPKGIDVKAWKIKVRPAKMKDQPTGARTSYILFSMQADKTKGPINEQWKALDSKEKAKFTELAKEDRVRATKEITEFASVHPEVKVPMAKTEEPRPTKALAHNLFVKDNRQKAMDEEELEGKELTSFLLEMWMDAKTSKNAVYLEYVNKAYDLNVGLEDRIKEWESKQSGTKTAAVQKVLSPSEKKKSEDPTYFFNEATGRYKLKPSRKTKESAKPVRKASKKASKKIEEISKQEEEEMAVDSE